MIKKTDIKERKRVPWRIKKRREKKGKTPESRAN